MSEDHTHTLLMIVELLDYKGLVTSPGILCTIEEHGCPWYNTKINTSAVGYTLGSLQSPCSESCTAWYCISSS